MPSVKETESGLSCLSGAGHAVGEVHAVDQEKLIERAGGRRKMRDASEQFLVKRNKEVLVTLLSGEADAYQF